MIPDNSLSPTPLQSPFIERVNRRTLPLVDYEMGGNALNDAADGLLVKQWTLRYENGNAIVSADGVPDTVLFNRPGITEIALAFDQLMNPFVAFTDSGGSTFYWFDPIAGAMAFFPYLPAGSFNLRCTMDDKRPLAQSTSDIILAYVRGGNLYFRQQRDRYLVERLLQAGVNAQLINVCMNRGNRLQFRLRPNA